MKRLDKFYNKEYSLILLYVVKAALMIFVLGLIIYYLAGKTGGAFAFVSGVLKPLVLGLVLTYLLSPLVGKLETKLFGSLKKPSARRGAAVLVTFGMIALVILLIAAVLVFTITKSVAALNIEDLKVFLIGLSEQFSRFWTTIEKQLASMNINLGNLGDWIGSLFNGVTSGVTTLLFASIFAIYFLIDKSIPVYWGRVVSIFASEEKKNKFREFGRDADKVFSGYIRGQSMDAALVGVMSSVALLIGGIPYAVVIGILTGVGNLVPYVGPVVGFGSLIIVCLAEHSLKHLIIGAVILALVMFIDGNVINPRMLSSNVEVHPVLVIIALIAGGKVGGVVGMLVAVPVAALLKHQFDKYCEAFSLNRRKHEG